MTNETLKLIELYESPNDPNPNNDPKKLSRDDIFQILAYGARSSSFNLWAEATNKLSQDYCNNFDSMKDRKSRAIRTVERYVWDETKYPTLVAKLRRARMDVLQAICGECHTDHRSKTRG